MNSGGSAGWISRANEVAAQGYELRKSRHSLENQPPAERRDKAQDAHHGYSDKETLHPIHIWKPKAPEGSDPGGLGKLPGLLTSYPLLILGSRADGSRFEF